jgi:glycosyltransferase involved in cell wall biosynthesis
LTTERPLLLDVSRLIWRRWIGRLPTGIDRVCLAYLDHYRARAQAVVQRGRVQRILPPGPSDCLFELLALPKATFRRDLVQLLARSAVSSPHPVTGRGRPYLNVGHTGLQNPHFLRWAQSADVRPIYFVHDLIPISHPEFCRPGEGERHRQRMDTVLKSAAGVIGNSRSTLDSLADFARERGMAAPPGIVALLGADLCPGKSLAYDPDSRPTFVVLGTIEARKNHLLLLHVWSRMVREMGPRTPRLLIIGQRGWECEQTFDLLDRSEVLRGFVVELGRCSDAELSRQLRGARALLFPSLAEGYGLPLVETLSLRTPVIASDLPVFREIGGGVPDYVDPLDGPAWQRTIMSYAEPASAARQAQLERMAGFKAPSWVEHFTKVDSWLASSDFGDKFSSLSAMDNTSVVTADSLASPPRIRHSSSSTRRNAS